MSFFKSIFKKKKGGTLVGNLLRSVSSSYTGGILGQGAMMIPLDEPTSQPSRQELANKLVSKASIKELPAVKETKTKVFIAGLKQNWYWVALGLVVLSVVVWLFSRQGGKKRKIK